MATHTIFDTNVVEIPANGLTVTNDGAVFYRMGTLFYTSGVGTTGWRCKGARIYLTSGGDELAITITLSLWVQPTIDASTLGTAPLRTATINTYTGRPGWFEATWDPVEVFPDQKFMVGYECAGADSNRYQYVPGSKDTPYDAAVQATDGASLFMSEDGGPNIRGYFYDTSGASSGNFSYYTGLDVLIEDDSEAPTDPTSLTATADGQKVLLAWNTSTDNVAVAGYRIYRGTTAGFSVDDTTRVATVSNVTSFTDILFSSNTYYYKINAIDGAGNTSGLSNEVSCSVTVDGTGVYLYPSDLGWSSGGTTTDARPGGQTLGTLFSVTQPSPIAGLRFYSPVNVTNNKVRLWADGVSVVVLDAVSFVSGWNVCLFEVPYSGVPGVQYCVSVYTSGATQSYTASAGMFSTTRTTVGTVYSETDLNGVFIDGDAYPATDFQASWYGIDAIVMAPPPRTGNIQVWDGTVWQSHPLKVWDGGSWVDHPASGYDGIDFIVGK